jgi:xanthine dehydrogenase/oxidase
MEIFTKVASENENFSYLNEIVKHYDLVANVPVRSNGTLAGNLMIKNAQNEFPSDVFITFECVGAILNISNGSSGWNLPFFAKSLGTSPKEFIASDMKKKVITKIILPAYDPAKFIFRSYKIMPRAQNAHAYVNAAFLLQFNEEQKIASAKLCFGGINPSFVHAEKTEALLVGQNIFNNEALQRALNTLNDEIKPDWVLPDASAEFRKNVAMALFYKFILKIAPVDVVSSKYKSGGEILKRDLSSGVQTFDTYEENWPLTKNIPKIEAQVQCTGEAKYVNDHPTLPGELHAAFVTAKSVHAIIDSINASKALVI